MFMSATKDASVHLGQNYLEKPETEKLKQCEAVRLRVTQEDARTFLVPASEVVFHRHLEYCVEQQTG